MTAILAESQLQWPPERKLRRHTGYGYRLERQ
jgi:hypothetical protein